MTRNQIGWAGWEFDVQKALGLDATVCSGNQFNDIGDAADNRHDSSWPMLVDCKYTDTKASWSLKARDVAKWFETAAERGKRGLMAIRIWRRGASFPDEFVVCSLNDYLELLEYYREGHQ